MGDQSDLPSVDAISVAVYVQGTYMFAVTDRKALPGERDTFFAAAKELLGPDAQLIIAPIVDVGPVLEILRIAIEGTRERGEMDAAEGLEGYRRQIQGMRASHLS